MKTFTPEQMYHWASYESVRSSGQFNMFDNRAIRATGLSKDQFFFVLENFDALKAAFYAQAEQS